MPNLTPAGLRLVAEVASRHGVSLEAAFAVLDSLALSNGTQAQFNHPDLGGMGQWSRGGMIMIGDMFNQGLKHRVDELCNELAGLVRDQRSIHGDPGRGQSQSQGGVGLFVEGSGSPSRWWPPELGEPASVGAQNEMRYAFFPASRRIAIQQGGRVSVYDSGEHRLSGFSQQQGGDQSLTFTSQFGVVRLADLAEVAAERETSREPSPTPAPEPRTPATATPATPDAPRAGNEILAIIESLASLREKNIISEEEFSAKKAELLHRL
ncbi:MAG TPA: SHOCT domain-containing protein [Roseiarcus sp.]|jgi:hypothetical protein